MGGCRCSWRSCTSRSDGKTHMFHYPVFDRVRCHQWLKNAGKLSFLQLKVSQLKNRVVCQHHFKDEYFMNYKKDKLTHNAVPTLNGPYCVEEIILDEPPNSYIISLDDIENEYLTFNDKKANFNVKYCDFLTNSDGLDMINVNTTQELTSKPGLKIVSVSSLQTRDQAADNIDINNMTNNNTIDNMQPLPNILNSHENNNQLIEIEIVNNDYSNLNKTVLNPRSPSSEPGKIKNENISFVSGEPKVEESQSVLSSYKDNSLNNSENELTNNSNQFSVKTPNIQNIAQDTVQNNAKVGPQKKIHIISEKKIYTPVPVVGNLEPIPFSKPLPLPNKYKIKKDITPTPTVITKKVISPERVAAIEKKRKFNMKLRDIIDSCLQKLDGQDQNLESNKDSVAESNCTHHCKESDLSNMQEYTMAYLDSRIKKMETNLLSKIDFNSQKILELKQTIVDTSVKKNAHTQTIIGEEARKKQLYQDISKYLSPEANSMIFEELFINRFKETLPKSPKRRKVK